MTSSGRKPSRHSSLGFLCIFLSWIKQWEKNNIKHAAQVLLLLIASFMGKSWTGYNDCSGCFSLQTCLKWHCAVCRLSPTHLSTPAKTGMYIFRNWWSLLLTLHCRVLAHHLIRQAGKFLHNDRSCHIVHKFPDRREVYSSLKLTAMLSVCALW